MGSQRNVVTLSDMDRELEEWAREEAKRRGKPFYQVVNDGLKLLRLVAKEYRQEVPAGRDSR